MVRLSARYMRKLVEKRFPYLLVDYGFFPYPGVSLLRVSNHILHCITFGSSQSKTRTTLTVFLQLLIKPTDFFGFSIGRDIRHPDSRLAEWYDFETDEAAEESVRMLDENIRQIALPLLNESTDLATLVSDEYQKRWGPLFWGESPAQNYLRALIHAFLGNKSEFMRLFDCLAPTFRDDWRDWAIKENENLKYLREHFDDRPQVREKFREFIDFSVRGLRLGDRVDIDALTTQCK
jgi:hypothetical protein